MLSQHVEQLKNYQPIDVHYRKNKIYFLEVEEKPFPKVGDSIRDVEERNKETMTNAALHRKKGTQPFYVVAEKWNGTKFRDKDFHTFLRGKNFKFELNDQGNESEWVQSNPQGNIPTVNELLVELAEFIQKPVTKSFKSRPAQDYILETEQQSIDNGFLFTNADYCMRSGKTLTSLETASRNDWMTVYLGKNLPSQNSAEVDNDEFGVVPNMSTESIHGPDGEEIDDSEVSSKVQKIIDSIESKNTLNQKIAFYVDEVDDSSHTKRSRAVIVPVVRYFIEKGMFGYAKTMSGTRAYRGLYILEELVKVYKEVTGIDVTIKELSLAYYEMQILQSKETCKRNFRHISFYTESGNLVSISDAMKNKDQGHKSLATCVVNLLGTNKFEFTVKQEFPHWFVKLATVGKGNANAFVKYMNRNHSVIENKEFHFAVINGDVTNSKKAQTYCKDIIEQQADKTCVFVSQGMATTSFSVKTIGNSVVFTDNEITSDDVQALHRSATWTDDKDDCNMIVVTTNDSKELAFDDIFEDEMKAAKTREEKALLLTTLLDNNSMIHFHEANGFAPVDVSKFKAEQIIDKKQQAMTKEASIVGVLLDLDEDVQEDIYTSVIGKKSTSKKSKGAKGEKFDPLGLGEDDTTSTNTKTTELTSNKKQQILRAFVDAAVMVPAVSREQGTTIGEFEFWNEIGVSEELFFAVYNASRQFKDRIDSIYNLCEDENYLVNNYIDKLAA